MMHGQGWLQRSEVQTRRRITLNFLPFQLSTVACRLDSYHDALDVLAPDPRPQPGLVKDVKSFTPVTFTYFQMPRRVSP